MFRAGAFAFCPMPGRNSPQPGPSDPLPGPVPGAGTPSGGTPGGGDIARQAQQYGRAMGLRVSVTVNGQVHSARTDAPGDFVHLDYSGGPKAPGRDGGPGAGHLVLGITTRRGSQALTVAPLPVAAVDLARGLATAGAALATGSARVSLASDSQTAQMAQALNRASPGSAGFSTGRELLGGLSTTVREALQRFPPKPTQGLYNYAVHLLIQGIVLGPDQLQEMSGVVKPKVFSRTDSLARAPGGDPPGFDRAARAILKKYPLFGGEQGPEYFGRIKGELSFLSIHQIKKILGPVFPQSSDPLSQSHPREPGEGRKQHARRLLVDHPELRYDFRRLSALTDISHKVLMEQGWARPDLPEALRALFSANPCGSRETAMAYAHRLHALDPGLTLKELSALSGASLVLLRRTEGIVVDQVTNAPRGLLNVAWQCPRTAGETAASYATRLHQQCPDLGFSNITQLTGLKLHEYCAIPALRSLTLKSVNLSLGEVADQIVRGPDETMLSHIGRLHGAFPALTNREIAVVTGARERAAHRAMMAVRLGGHEAPTVRQAQVRAAVRLEGPKPRPLPVRIAPAAASGPPGTKTPAAKATMPIPAPSPGTDDLLTQALAEIGGLSPDPTLAGLDEGGAKLLDWLLDSGSGGAGGADATDRVEEPPPKRPRIDMATLEPLPAQPPTPAQAPSAPGGAPALSPLSSLPPLPPIGSPPPLPATPRTPSPADLSLIGGTSNWGINEAHLCLNAVKKLLPDAAPLPVYWGGDALQAILDRPDKSKPAIELQFFGSLRLHAPDLERPMRLGSAPRNWAYALSQVLPKPQWQALCSHLTQAAQESPASSSAMAPGGLKAPQPPTRGGDFGELLAQGLRAYIGALPPDQQDALGSAPLMAPPTAPPQHGHPEGF